MLIVEGADVCECLHTFYFTFEKWQAFRLELNLHVDFAFNTFPFPRTPPFLPFVISLLFARVLLLQSYRTDFIPSRMLVFVVVLLPSFRFNSK